MSVYFAAIAFCISSSAGREPEVFKKRGNFLYKNYWRKAGRLAEKRGALNNAARYVCQFNVPRWKTHHVKLTYFTQRFRPKNVLAFAIQNTILILSLLCGLKHGFVTGWLPNDIHFKPLCGVLGIKVPQRQKQAAGKCPLEKDFDKPWSQEYPFTQIVINIVH